MLAKWNRGYISLWKVSLIKVETEGFYLHIWYFSLAREFVKKELLIRWSCSFLNLGSKPVSSKTIRRKGLLTCVDFQDIKKRYLNKIWIFIKSFNCLLLQWIRIRARRLPKTQTCYTIYSKVSNRNYTLAEFKADSSDFVSSNSTWLSLLVSFASDLCLLRTGSVSKSSSGFRLPSELALLELAMGKLKLKENNPTEKKAKLFV